MDKIRKNISRKLQKLLQNNETKQVIKLLDKYNDVIKTLQNMKVIRSKNNPAGDVGEYFISKMYGLTIVPNSTKGYDAIDNKGVKYQIKTRRITAKNKSRQLGAFRDLDEKLFDYCIAIILSSDFIPAEIWKIPHKIICKYAKKTNRGFDRIILDGAILKEPTVKQLLKPIKFIY